MIPSGFKGMTKRLELEHYPLNSCTKINTEHCTEINQDLATMKLEQATTGTPLSH
jgi:hypothetical protein